jgi:hypothetical protein
VLWRSGGTGSRGIAVTNRWSGYRAVGVTGDSSKKRCRKQVSAVASAAGQQGGCGRGLILAPNAASALAQVYNVSSENGRVYPCVDL